MKLTLFNKETFEIFVHPGEATEVRIPKVYGKSEAWANEFARGTVSGYFDSHEAFCTAVKQADKGSHDGIYFTLQVIDPRLIGRAFNRLKPSNLTTSDRNVIAYRWLPVDLDPVRPGGISASDSELAEAMKLREEVAQWVMSELNFPSPIKGMSGNGGHLLFRLPDLPTNEDNQAFIKATLEGLAERFDTDKVTIDTSVYNPARIWKLYGTIAKKGDSIPPGQYREVRPHRMTYIDHLGEEAND